MIAYVVFVQDIYCMCALPLDVGVFEYLVCVSEMGTIKKIREALSFKQSFLTRHVETLKRSVQFARKNEEKNRQMP